MKKTAISLVIGLSICVSANAEELNVTANGIGLGTATPSKPLHVVGNKPGDTVSYLQNTDSTGYAGFEFRTYDDVFGGFFGYWNANQQYRFNVTDAGYYSWNFHPSGGEVMTLDSSGNLTAKAFYTPAGQVADYVFDEGYKLMPLDELEDFITENKHLPNVPSQADVNSQGYIDVSEYSMKTLEKTEELTLYILELNRSVNSLKEENKRLSDQLNSLQAR